MPERAIFRIIKCKFLSRELLLLLFAAATVIAGNVRMGRAGVRFQTITARINIEKKDRIVKYSRRRGMHTLPLQNGYISQ